MPPIILSGPVIKYCYTQPLNAERCKLKSMVNIYPNDLQIELITQGNETDDA